MGSDYIPAALTIVFAVGFATLLSFAAQFLGGGRKSKEKNIPYEAGSDVLGTPRAPFSVKFYQVAIMFLVFDIEAAFLYPWAVNFKALSCTQPLQNGVCTSDVSFLGLGSVVLFMSVLVVALVYVWRKRAIGWES